MNTLNRLLHLSLPVFAVAMLGMACQPADRNTDTTSPLPSERPTPPEEPFTPTKSIPKWEMYVDSDSYAIQYPPAWKIKVGKGSDTEMLRIESPNGRNALTIQGLASLSAKPLSAMCESLAVTLDVEVLEQTTDTLGGKPACRVHYAFRTNDNRQIKETFFVTENGLGIIFHYYTLSGNAPELEGILHSIQFQ